MGQREVEVWCYRQRTGSIVPNVAKGAWLSYLLRDWSGCGLSQGWGLALEKWLPLAEDSAQGETHLCALSSKSPHTPRLGYCTGAFRTDSHRPPRHPLCSVSTVTWERIRRTEGVHRGRTLDGCPCLGQEKSWGKDSEKVAGPTKCRFLRGWRVAGVRASGRN